MTIRSCRDCVNFEERRDVDNVALCVRKIGPHVCCDEFEPRDENLKADKLYYRFCVECANFEDADGIPLCGQNHTPGVACEEFKSRFEKLNATRQKNHMKTALLVHAANEYSNPEPISAYLIEIGRKIKW